MQPQPHLHRQNKGLSKPIIALLVGAGCFSVAIPVTAILASIALPMYTRFKKEAQLAQLVQHQQAFAVRAMQGQLTDGHFPKEVADREELLRIAEAPLPNFFQGFAYEGGELTMELVYSFEILGLGDQWLSIEVQRDGAHFREQVSSSLSEFRQDYRGSRDIHMLTLQIEE